VEETVQEIDSNSESSRPNAKSPFRLVFTTVFALALGLGVNAIIFSGGLHSFGIRFLQARCGLSNQEAQRETQLKSDPLQSRRIDHAYSDCFFSKQFTPAADSTSQDRLHRIEIYSSGLKQATLNRVPQLCREGQSETIGP
jgi:hypothetical protein